MKNTFKLVQILQNLNRIKRSGGGLFLGLPDSMRLSIAEHSYMTAYLAVIFAKNEGVDEAKILRYTVTHDWGEAVIGDLPSGSPSWRSFWQNDIRSDAKKAEETVKKAMDDLVKDEVELNLVSEQLGEKEKLIFDLADLVAMLLEMLEWKYSGLKHDGFEMIWFNTIDRIKSIELETAKDWAEMLNEAYKKGSKDYNVFLAKPQLQTNPEHKI